MRYTIKSKSIKMHVTFMMVLVSIFANAQEKIQYSSDPLNAHVVTDDVERFWQAYDNMDSLGVKAFEEYINKGTAGLQGFIPYRIINADSLYNMVQRKKQDYLNTRNLLDDIEGKKKRIRSIYSAMKYWYPYAQFPPVYFVVGRFNSGGTISDTGIILGTEMQKDLVGLPWIIAHELIHYQQRLNFKKVNILTQSLMEGSADFIAELISGENVSQIGYYKYARNHTADLKKEFVRTMNSEDFTDWFYGTSGKDDRPNDLGYWMGYEIAKKYFDQHTNKKQAIHDILFISEPYDFLIESGYLNKEIEELAKEKGVSVEMLIKSLKE